MSVNLKMGWGWYSVEVSQLSTRSKMKICKSRGEMIKFDKKQLKIWVWRPRHTTTPRPRRREVYRPSNFLIKQITRLTLPTYLKWLGSQILFRLHIMRRWLIRWLPRLWVSRRKLNWKITVRTRGKEDLQIWCPRLIPLKFQPKPNKL